MPPTTTTTTPDSLIDPSVALSYWNSTPATVSGMLGGFPQVSRLDLQTSSSFLAKLRRQQSRPPATKKRKTTTPLPPLPRAVDCGAGIGRITHGMLLRVASQVDVVEPVGKFTQELQRQYNASTSTTKRGKLGTIFNVPLENWVPASERWYDLVWIQWCSNQLTDAALTALLRRCGEVLVEPVTPAVEEGAEEVEEEEEREVVPGGLIVVKENMGTDPTGADTFDDEDSSVTRPQDKYRAIFAAAGLSVVATELQLGFPGELYPVRMFALQPTRWFA